MMFTKAKGTWQVETTKGQVVEAMRHVMETLAKYQDILPENKTNQFITFQYPRVLNTYTAVP
eukprot:15362525-Ditylum_brightwellii.AAC.1